MKLYKVKHKDEESIDSVIERKSRFGNENDHLLLSQAEVIWNTFSPVRAKRERVIRFTYEDQWGDLINVNGKTMTQREYLSKVGNVALQANLMVSKANSIVGSHIKEGAVPSIHSRLREQQRLGEILSETLRANWDNNDMSEIESQCEFELLFGGFCVVKESFERVEGEDDAWTRMVNPNMVAWCSSMQDPRLRDMSMIVELHDYTFNELCAAFVEKPEDYDKLKEWFNNASSPLHHNDQIDVTEKNDSRRITFYSPVDSKNCRVIEVWTKERRARYRVHDLNSAELYDINADDVGMLDKIKEINRERTRQARENGFADDEIPLIELHYFVDEFWYYRFLTPKGFILSEGESDLPGRTHPYTICATPLVNGKICGFLSDAVDLQMAINRELVLYDWMKRLGTKGVTFVPKDIIPDDMDYNTFAEQWTSMDGIVYYKPNKSGDKPFTEHGNVNNLNTAEMVKMLSDTMSESVSVSGAIQGKTPYAGTSAQLYAQQKENSTTPIAVIMGKLETFTKHVAIKKTQFIQMYYNLEQYIEVAGGMVNSDISDINIEDMQKLRFKFKYVIGADHTSLRQESNELLIQMLTTGALNIADVLELGEFRNADSIIERLNQRAAEMQANQAIAADYENKRNQIQGK